MKEELIRERVRFERPVVRALADRGYQSVDMHFHTNHSDSRTTVRSALSLARKTGIGLSITDHNTITGVLEARALDTGVPVVPGVEVSTADGPHILLYFFSFDEMREFYRKELEGRKGESPFLATTLSTVDLLDVAEPYNCVRAAAHPYGYLFMNRGVAKCVENMCLDDEVLDRFDAFEVICGGMNRRGNLRSATLAIEKKLGMVGGTDGHMLKDLGNVITAAPTCSVEDFLEAVLHHRTIVMGIEKTALEKGLMGMAVLSKHLPYTIPSLAVHYRQNVPRVRRFVRRKTIRR